MARKIAVLVGRTDILKSSNNALQRGNTWPVYSIFSLQWFLGHIPSFTTVTPTVQVYLTGENITPTCLLGKKKSKEGFLQLLSEEDKMWTDGFPEKMQWRQSLGAQSMCSGLRLPAFASSPLNHCMTLASYSAFWNSVIIVGRGEAWLMTAPIPWGWWEA